MYKDRLLKYIELEKIRNSKILVYITGDRPNMETQIHQEVLGFFGDHLDTFDFPKRISLFLYSRGGNTLAGWSIVNLIRQFCKEFEVILPSKALSTATIICLGANNILMTKQATLGPIDPSINTPLNPQVPGAGPNARVPVSVEAIKGYIELAKNEFGLKGAGQLQEILLKLSEKVHPLVLGEVYRARTQIKLLAQSLLSQSKQVTDEDKLEKITAFLCSESGSHDYTINRREASEKLGLKIEKPDDNLYNIIKIIFTDIRNELQLDTPYNPAALLGQEDQIDYGFSRCILESVANGSHVFSSEGVLRKTKVQIQPGVVKNTIDDQRTYEGWKHYDC